MTFDAVIVCGGTGRRLGGMDKAAVVVGGRTLLERAAAAVAGARRTIAVGPARATSSVVTWTQEEPPGGGPAAALEAGIGLVTAELVAVVGVDFPLLGAETIARLAASVGAADGAILRDGAGRDQFLAGVYRTSSLRRALEARRNRGRAMRDVVASLDLQVIVDEEAARDCDTWDAVRVAEATLAARDT
ncbi:MAG TPA: NTP transferase domain-containing protein [Actinomycetota bacterium]|nr:NTP transferase domain-containing protein [Actinomycetota bacterium]